MRKNKYVKPKMNIVYVDMSETLLSASDGTGRTTMSFGGDADANLTGESKGHSSLWDFDED